MCLLAPAPDARAEQVVLRPGPEGIDTAPYQFTPAIVRGNRETLYAFTDPDQVHSFETFLRFELPPDLVGPEERIEAARLALYYGFDFDVYGDTTGIPGSIECHEVLEPWSESITWSQRPSYGPPVDVLDGITELGTVTCDVTELVADWVEGVRPNHGIAITNPTFRVIGFFSSDIQPSEEVPESVRPALLVDVAPVPEPAAGAAAAAVALALAAWRRKGATA
jgi:hypothetical protein